MSFEDAETLAWALGHEQDATEPLLPLWEAHRQQRVREVVTYTTGIEHKRRPSPNVVIQKFKEFVFSGMMWYNGKAGLGQWVNSYNGEDQMAEFCKEAIRK